jgi:hypothetical protein
MPQRWAAHSRVEEQRSLHPARVGDASLHHQRTQSAVHLTNAALLVQRSTACGPRRASRRCTPWMQCTQRGVLLQMRTVQRGCSHLARLASMPTPAPTPEPSESEVNAAVEAALAPVDACPHCGSSTCHACCGGPGSPEKAAPAKKVRSWRRKKDKPAKEPEPAAQEQAPPAPAPPDEDINQDHVKYVKAGAKALKVVYGAIGSASLWMANYLHHAVS